MAFNILEHVALAYQPIWGHARQLVGVRLRVRALHLESVDAAHFLNLLSNEWSEQSPFLLVSFADQPQLQQALAFRPFPSIWLELPDMGDFTPVELVDAIVQARSKGHRLVQCAPLARAKPVPNTGVGALRYLLDVWPEQVEQALQAMKHRGQRGAPPSPILPGELYQHVGQLDLVKHCLDERRAWGVCGWPVRDVLQGYHRYGVPVDRRTLVRLQQALMREASLDEVENIIHQDAMLTFRMLRMVNSPVFGTSRQVTTIRLAIMMLGQIRLRDWLLELMPGTSNDHDLQPVRLGHSLRARLMAYLMDAGAQHDLRNEIYLTGLFSSLDQLMHEPLAHALGRVPVPEAVSSALLHHAGPYHPYLDLAKRMEHFEQVDHMPQVCEQAGFAMDHVNRSLIRMLAHWHNVL